MNRSEHLELERAEYATVNELIEILQREVAAGKGDYLVSTGDEGWLARKAEIPHSDDQRGVLDIGYYP